MFGFNFRFSFKGFFFQHMYFRSFCEKQNIMKVQQIHIDLNTRSTKGIIWFLVWFCFPFCIFKYPQIYNICINIAFVSFCLFLFTCFVYLFIIFILWGCCCCHLFSFYLRTKPNCLTDIRYVVFVCLISICIWACQDIDLKKKNKTRNKRWRLVALYFTKKK